MRRRTDFRRRLNGATVAGHYYLLELARCNPCVLVTGLRQSGKTTLARACFPKSPYVSLEDPDIRASALTDPRGFLTSLQKGAVIDEVQRAVASSNTNLPTGRLDGDKQAFTIESSGSLATAAAYRPIIVAWKNGSAVRLGELELGE